MKILSGEQNNEDFSELCHQYFKLATMRVMQSIRKKYNVPPEEIESLTLEIFARFLNEGCYAVGAAIKNGLPLYHIIPKEQILVLLKILSGEPLDPVSRTDIDTDIHRSLKKFREFIADNASDFSI